MECHCSLHLLLLCLTLSQLCQGHRAMACPADRDPTCGFEPVALNTSNFLHVDKPYDLPLSARYSFVHGVHRMWVLSTDKPYRAESPTRPRTEIRLEVRNILHISIRCGLPLVEYDHTSIIIVAGM